MLRPCHPISPEATLQPLRTERDLLGTFWRFQVQTCRCQGDVYSWGKAFYGETGLFTQVLCDLPFKLVKPDNYDGEMLCHHGVPHVALPRFFPLILENYVGNSPVPGSSGNCLLPQCGPCQVESVPRFAAQASVLSMEQPVFVIRMIMFFVSQDPEMEENLLCVTMMSMYF